MPIQHRTGCITRVLAGGKS